MSIKERKLKVYGCPDCGSEWTEPEMKDRIKDGQLCICSRTEPLEDMGETVMVACEHGTSPDNLCWQCNPESGEHG